MALVNPCGRHPAGDNLEEASVIGPADMRENAHRDDPVERAVERAIVDLFEPHPVRNPCFLCPPPCDRELFVGERDRSEEHTSELQSLMRISYAVFCLKKKNI